MKGAVNTAPNLRQTKQPINNLNLVPRELFPGFGWDVPPKAREECPGYEVVNNLLLRDPLSVLRQLKVVHIYL